MNCECFYILNTEEQANKYAEYLATFTEVEQIELEPVAIGKVIKPFYCTKEYGYGRRFKAKEDQYIVCAYGKYHYMEDFVTAQDKKYFPGLRLAFPDDVNGFNYKEHIEDIQEL